jgi:hypothetical protein
MVDARSTARCGGVLFGVLPQQRENGGEHWRSVTGIDCVAIVGHVGRVRERVWVADEP